MADMSEAGDNGGPGVSSSASSDVLARVCALADASAKAQGELARSSGERRSRLLRSLADGLDEGAVRIAEANGIDMDRARAENMEEGLLDRLLFDEARVREVSEGVRSVASLPDPLGEVMRGYTLANGLRLNQVRVPIGVFGMIYEARPNVTVDVVSLCLKSGNAVVLRGGHAALHTNEAIVDIVHGVLEHEGFDEHLVASVDRLGRPGATAMMEARGHIDVLVPRGGSELIDAVVRNAKVPVIETGAGNVHIYVDGSADLGKAVPIVMNAKTQRVGVCNAAEKLLVHSDVAQSFLPVAGRSLAKAGVTLHADSEAYQVLEHAGIDGLKLVHAVEDDWSREYLSLDMGVKAVDSVDCAIDHISRYSTGHTECIIAEDYSAIERFTAGVDSAVVMVNASSRFTDGGMFGFGAELGISTQKLHARGPMGLTEMTTTKWIGYGTGQVRQ